MGMPLQQSEHMSRRALLTDREREVLRGEADDVENPDGYRSKILSRLKHREKRLQEDLELLEEHAPERAEAIQTAICGALEPRISELEQEVSDLQKRMPDS